MRWIPPFLALAVLLAAPVARGQAPVPEKPDPTRFRLLLEPRFQAPPVWQLLDGAKETGIAPGTLDASGNPVFLTPGDLALAQLDLAAFRRQMLPRVDVLLEKSTPKAILDKDGKTTHVIYHGKDPLTATILLSPKLLARHQTDLGDLLLAVVPDRYTLILFRADVELLESQAELITGIHSQSIYPVSLEIFQIDDSGLRCIGNLAGE